MNLQELSVLNYDKSILQGHYVYKLTNQVNQKTYIGRSCKPLDRLDRYINVQDRINSELKEDLSKYGLASFTVELYKTKNSLQAEMDMINYLKVNNVVLYNKELYYYNVFSENEYNVASYLPVDLTNLQAHAGKVVTDNEAKKFYNDSLKTFKENVAVTLLTKYNYHLQKLDDTKYKMKKESLFDDINVTVTIEYIPSTKSILINNSKVDYHLIYVSRDFCMYILKTTELPDYIKSYVIDLEYLRNNTKKVFFN